jgi:A/G-specific adenine glycosylase
VFIKMNIQCLKKYLHNGSISDEGIRQFREIIYNYYRSHERSFKWRSTHNPYFILLSELMLQQTQTDRVVAKYDLFVSTFPTIQDLASARIKDVLSLWQGLGYNRRAYALHSICTNIVQRYNGVVPDTPEELITLKHIGPYTSGAICAFAYNKPTVFIETNIRSVFIKLFFDGEDNIHDKDIFPLIEQTVDKSDPRNWYYALMDYGVMLKKMFKNPNTKSKHYAKQSKFEGSDRQIRSFILKQLLIFHTCSYDDLYHLIKDNLGAHDHDRISHIIDKMIKQELLVYTDNMYFLPE